MLMPVIALGFTVYALMGWLITLMYYVFRCLHVMVYILFVHGGQDVAVICAMPWISGHGWILFDAILGWYIFLHDGMVDGQSFFIDLVIFMIVVLYSRWRSDCSFMHVR